jgi:hypothetical protein
MGEKLKPCSVKRRGNVGCHVKALLSERYLKSLSSGKLVSSEYLYYYEIRDFIHKTEGTTRRPGVTKETLAEKKVS